ncbi:MAG: hypothetical protein IPL61_18590 [Myxococcales bacterium]|nr:hypothetical protein [Myxococcales bacterium]
MAKQTLPRTASKVGKASRGPTPTATTALDIRARPKVEATLEATIRAKTTAALARWATLIERVTIRFADVNGPRGGVDTRCSIHVGLTGVPPVQIEHLGASRALAWAPALRSAVQAIRRLLDRRGRSAGRASVPDAARPKLAGAPSLIGRREGRAALAQAMVLARPEKQVRDLWVDTAQPGVSETDRAAGAGHSARRNTRGSKAGMTSTLEDSLATPSRKSTRRSANHGKPSHGKERAAVAAVIAPKARATRSRARAR